MSKSTSKALSPVKPKSVVHQAGRIFKPWQRDFARWLVRNGRTTEIERIDRLHAITGWVWTPQRLRVLLQNKLFQEYIKVLRAGGARLAKLRISEVAPKAIDKLDEVLDAAWRDDDFPTVVKAANTIMNQFERLDTTTVQLPPINIQIVSRQKSVLDDGPIEVSFEPTDKPDA